MCFNCWERAGKPFEYTAAVKQWAPVFADANPAGAMHSVTEDWNLDDECIESSQTDPEANEHDQTLCAALLKMSEGERWATAIIAEWPEFTTAQQYEDIFKE